MSSRTAPALFALLVAATFGAFFVAQSLKNSPSKIGLLKYAGVFSPNQDGRKERLRLTFRLDEADRVTVTVLDDKGDPVRTLLDDRRVGAYRPLDPALAWDGKDDDGRVVPDGRYRFRITLRDQGRNVVLPRSFLKDTAPPVPRIASMGPEPGASPEILPAVAGREAIARFATPALGKNAKVRLFKMAPGTPRQVLERPIAAGAKEWRWDGELDGRRAAPGTYAVVAEWRDQGENVGTSVPLDENGIPEVPRGKRFPGRGGITVRYLGIQAPLEPVRAGERFRFCVDSRRERWSWTLRRVGQPQPVKRGNATSKACSTPKAPNGESSAYVLEVRSGARTAQAPIMVQGRRARSVLVVLPAITWQGRNGADDDGDGRPNLLDLGVSVGMDRILASGLPRQFREREAPFLQWLNRTGRRYDLTTDLALERRTGPRIAGHKGVVLVGETRWSTPRNRRDLKDFVRRGGKLLELGPDSLRRVVEVSGSGRRLTTPRPAAPTDLFGLRLGRVQSRAVDLEVSPLPDEIALFTGTTGLFPGVTGWEEVVRAGQEVDPVASTVTVDPPGRTVMLAASLGKGLVIRPGLVDLPTQLDDSEALTTLTERVWTLLSR